MTKTNTTISVNPALKAQFAAKFVGDNKQYNSFSGFVESAMRGHMDNDALDSEVFIDPETRADKIAEMTMLSNRLDEVRKSLEREESQEEVIKEVDIDAIEA